ncbi:MAG TPA: PspC domain-containing protein, partial [Microthrixaceae bacterium]|nr:PspC domain-containing protein [Microthrixaceae bacterium]
MVLTLGNGQDHSMESQVPPEPADPGSPDPESADAGSPETVPEEPSLGAPLGGPEAPASDTFGSETSDVFTHAGAWLRSLRRSTSNRIVAGVAGGLAERIGVPSLVVRAAFVIAAVAGFGIPIYVIAWIFTPTDRGDRMTDGRGVRDLLALAIIVLVGLILSPMVTASFDRIWKLTPWVLVLLGVGLVLRRSEASPDQSQDPSEPAIQAQHESGDRPPYPTAPVRTPRGAARSRAPGPLRLPRFPVVGLLTWCAVLITCGALGVLSLSGVISIGPGVVAGFALLVFGGGLVFSAFRGKARGLILPALALAVVLGGLGAIDLRIDNADPSFHRIVADPAELPRALRTSVTSSSLNLRTLELSSDRYLRIDQTGGDLLVVLPTDVNVTVDVTLGIGEVRLTRPDRMNAVYSHPEVVRQWLKDGIPKPGDPVAGALYRKGSNGETIQMWGDPNVLTSGVNKRISKTFDRGSEHTLQLEIHMGAGSIELSDPHWSGAPMSEVSEPAQLCTVGGGPRGVVKKCSDVEAAKRVALCINDNDLLVDCREDRPATPDYPRVPACTDFFGDETDCALVEIKVVGAQLVTPGLVSLDDPGGTGVDSPDTDSRADDWGDGSGDGSGDVPLEERTTNTIKMPDGVPVPEAPA